MINEWDDPLLAELTKHTLLLGSSAQEQLAQLAHDIAWLDCEDTSLESFEHVARFQGLRVLDVSSTQLTSFEGVERLRMLELLYADFCRFPDLSPLSALADLRALDISCSLVDSCDLTPLAGLKRLERLYIAHCPVMTLGPLMQTRSLRLLSIAGTEIPEEEISRFRALHPNCEIWTSDSSE